MDLFNLPGLLLAFMLFMLGASTLAVVLAFYVTHERPKSDKKEGEK